MARKIKLADGKIALVDNRDYKRVSRHRWHVHPAPTMLYARTYIKELSRPWLYKRVLMHCFIIGAKGLDHRNRNGLDNRRSNLRKCTPSQNGCNRIGWGQSGFKGVYKRDDMQGFRASIGIGGRWIHLGTFKTIEKAVRARRRAAKKYHKEFARQEWITKRKR